MEIEHLIRYTELAVGLKPSAMQGEARLRGLYRSNCSKTISPRLWKAKPACAGYDGLLLQRPSFRSPRGECDSEECSTLSIGFNLWENCYNPVAELAGGLKPSAMEDEARLHGLEWSNCSKTIISGLHSASSGRLA